MKRIAAITMVRNDDFFLSKWVGYYGRQLGKENLHVIFDGLDQKVPEFCDGVNVERVEHVKGNVHEADRGRIDLISQRAARLFDRYDMVIGTDVDEFLVVDPLLGQTLAQFLSGVTTGLPSISGLGVDVGQKIGEEDDIRSDIPFLRQRRYAQIGTRYTKPSIVAAPCRWPARPGRFPGSGTESAAAAMGAIVIEKHFTLDRTLPGPDHKASLEPGELKEMVEAIRAVELALGNGRKKPADCELANIAVARKSIVAKTSIPKGTIFTQENITVKRPGTGISPMCWFEVIGQKAVRDFSEDEMIEL